MRLPRLRVSNDTLVRYIAFVGAFAAVLAQADDLSNPRYWMAALAAGCTALLALMRAPNTTVAPAPNEQRPGIGGQRG